MTTTKTGSDALLRANQNLHRAQVAYEMAGDAAALRWFNGKAATALRGEVDRHKAEVARLRAEIVKSS